MDFKSIVTRTSETKPPPIIVADKGYGSDENHVFVREHLKSYIMQHHSSRNTHVLIYGGHVVDNTGSTISN
jgi:hypothetical protein